VQERDIIRDSGDQAPGRRSAKCQRLICRAVPTLRLRVFSLNGIALSRVVLLIRDARGWLSLVATF
jgi:hypothetical protein